jgi:hypothetical protein
VDAALLEWLASLPAGERDRAVEERLGLTPEGSASPGEHLVGYHPSGVGPIVEALASVPVEEGDVLVDLGSGLGKVVLLTALLTPATARGIEIQPALARRASASAERLGLAARARFDAGDVRDETVSLDDGTVFFLYLPFTGPALARVASRLEAVARRKPIVVATVGIDLDRVPWLVRRDLTAFWLALYDSAVPGIPSRRRGAPTQTDAVSIIAAEAPPR